MEKETKCIFCGKQMSFIKSRKMFCSRQCINKYYNRERYDGGLEMARELLPKRTPYKEPDLSIAEVQRRAREMGMTYGQYVSRFGG